ncbi:MAG TPA: anthranilate phosphoribosyltransferase, partial [Candidatus Sumerlaeota bacterium]|nr:anthranilate phosphoribosyltransferase [Candidatus Sumerlaeota bacterium]
DAASPPRRTATIDATAPPERSELVLRSPDGAIARDVSVGVTQHGVLVADGADAHDGVIALGPLTGAADVFVAAEDLLVTRLPAEFAPGRRVELTLPRGAPVTGHVLVYGRLPTEPIVLSAVLDAPIAYPSELRTDVLQALGYKIDCAAETSARMLRDHNFCFLFAPLYHPAMKHAGPVRREIKVRTIFNLAGPLSNPALPSRQLLGVSHPSMLELMAQALKLLGRERALIVHGGEGHDEISLSQITHGILLAADGEFRKLTIDPADFGVKGATLQSLAIASPADSAEKLRRVLEGEQSVIADEINVNVGAVLWLADRVGGLRDGFEIAREIQRSGKGAELLQTLIAESNKEA